MMSTQPRPVRIPPPRGADSVSAHPLMDAFSPFSAPGVDQTADTDTLPLDGDQLQTELDKLVNRFDLLHAQLRQAQKLASLGATAATIAHEFNNLFTPIVAYGRQALDTDDVPLMRKALTKTLAQVDVMRNMCDRVVGLARQSDGSIKAVNVLKVVTNAIECLCRDPAKDNITVQVQIDPDLCARTNEGALLQVVFNMVINARQAMLGRRGRLTLDAAALNGRVQLNIRDTGCGIPPENLELIFDPFFTTKAGADRPDKRGLGLGLSICRDIIEELGGNIRVSSQVNVGTTFTIELPE